MNKTITIEASNIYFRGGFVLLEQLLEYCEQNSLEAKVYIGYKEVFDYFGMKKYKNISLIKTNGLKTFLRYFKRRNSTLFFCNLPPFAKCEQSVLYAHNILFFQSPKAVSGQSVVFNLKKFVYYYWIKFFARNVDVVACQTEAVQKSLWENMQVKSELYPFYREASPLPLERVYEFCYVGSGAPHKNNSRLLEAVDKLSEKYSFRLVMTINDSDTGNVLNEKIDAINRKYKRTVVVNKGYMPYDEVREIYSSTRALIFPSQAETIALPLIEGLQFGLKILSSDLPFTHQVVENPIVFNPESVDEIVNVMENQLKGKYDDIVQTNRIPNRLEELVKLVSCPLKGE